MKIINSIYNFSGVTICLISPTLLEVFQENEVRGLEVS